MKKQKLTVIVANKFLYPRGGDCLYTLRLMELLSQKGHDVIPFGMHHPQNIKTKYGEYFVPYIDFREELKSFRPQNALKVISRAIVNTRAAELMEQLIEDVRPDVIHLNNIHHQLTPAILSAPQKYRIPVVWTLHDYILNCPDNTFLRQGKICTKCADGNNIHAVIHRCKKGSLGASLIAALESTYFCPRKLAQAVKMFISPSKFLGNILIKHRLAANQVISIPNFLPIMEISSTGEDYFLYFGRLSEEKGVDLLIKAFAAIGGGKLVIAGDGPERTRLESLAEHYSSAEIKFIGHQSPAKINELLAGCLASIVPSIWWENFPYSVMEAMALGKPVIASRTGGIPEQVEHGRTGLIFTPGRIDELAECMKKVMHDRNTAREMGQQGRLKVITEYNAETHYKNILNIYQEVIDNNSIDFKHEARELVTAN